jgi:hypothetical protein
MSLQYDLENQFCREIVATKTRTAVNEIMSRAKSELSYFSYNVVLTFKLSLEYQFAD